MRVASCLNLSQVMNLSGMVVVVCRIAIREGLGNEKEESKILRSWGTSCCPVQPPL